jgi:hypothetical protein
VTAPRQKAKKYKHECAVLDTGHLQARCFENRETTPHWSGTPQDQKKQGAAGAHVAAITELNAHVQETGHTPFKHRHGGARGRTAGGSGLPPAP